jgi:hypothetical protein
MLLAAAAAVAGLVAVAGPAQAAPPVLQSSSYDLPAATPTDTSGYCLFPVHIDIVAHQKFQETKLPDGTVITHITGYSSATVTRTDTTPVKSLTYKISGPGTLTVFPDDSFTIDAGGQNLLWTTVANSFTGVPQVSYTTGHVQVAVDENGLTTDYSLSGRQTDVCAALS